MSAVSCCSGSLTNHNRSVHPPQSLCLEQVIDIQHFSHSEPIENTVILRVGCPSFKLSDFGCPEHIDHLPAISQQLVCNRRTEMSFTASGLSEDCKPSLAAICNKIPCGFEHCLLPVLKRLEVCKPFFEQVAHIRAVSIGNNRPFCLTFAHPCDKVSILRNVQQMPFIAADRAVKAGQIAWFQVIFLNLKCLSAFIAKGSVGRVAIYRSILVPVIP